MSDSAVQSAMTLPEYTGMLSQHINSAPHLMRRWVVAEVSNLRMSGPHCYGILIYKDDAGKTIAKISCNIWANNWNKIYYKFLDATGRPISEGMKIMFLLSANHSPAYGLSVNIQDVDPSYTLGDAERLRREILNTLAKEGIIDKNKGKELPLAPQRIAVISAAGAAGYGDFINQIENSGYTFYPHLFPAIMQGQNTVRTVLKALEKIEETIDLWDCVVIIRGGGATDDLNSFDNLELARRVADFVIPVIVGIGHERDRTVLDEIAHTRCKTPTAVAAFLIQTLVEAEQKAENATRKIVEFVRMTLLGEEKRLAQYSSTLPHLAPRRLETEKHRVELYQSKIVQLALARTTDADKQLNQIASRIEMASRQALTAPLERLRMIPETIRQIVDYRIDMERQKLRARNDMIDVLSPAATLRRGYSITRINGKAIHSLSDAPDGAEIETTLPDGKILSKITTKSPHSQ